MKYIFSLLLLTSYLVCVSQDIYEIKLVKTLDETRMGIWTTGDYTVQVELNTMETGFRTTGNAYLNSALTVKDDEALVSIYNLSSKRYLNAADQLRHASNGFDLKTLHVYYGQESEQQNTEISSIVENYVRGLVESGMSVVYYKGERVYTLKRRIESEGEGLSYGYHELLYAYDAANCMFKSYHHLGW